MLYYIINSVLVFCIALNAVSDVSGVRLLNICHFVDEVF